MNHLTFLDFFSGFSLFEGLEVIVSVIGLGALLRIGSLLLDSLIVDLKWFLGLFKKR